MALTKTDIELITALIRANAGTGEEAPKVEMTAHPKAGRGKTETTAPRAAEASILGTVTKVGETKGGKAIVEDGHGIRWFVGGPATLQGAVYIDGDPVGVEDPRTDLTKVGSSWSSGIYVTPRSMKVLMALRAGEKVTVTLRKA